MMAILRMSFVMFVKALETKMAADTTSSPDESLSSSIAGAVSKSLF